jgi:hypothetical protein
MLQSIINGLEFYLLKYQIIISIKSLYRSMKIYSYACLSVSFSIKLILWYFGSLILLEIILFDQVFYIVSSILQLWSFQIFGQLYQSSLNWHNEQLCNFYHNLKFNLFFFNIILCLANDSFVKNPFKGQMRLLIC